MNIEILKSIKEITQRISSFFIFLFIYLVLRDIVEVVKFDLSVDDVKYILSFNALLYTSILITGFFLLIYILANKNILSYFIVLLCFVVFFIFNGIGDMEKFLAFIFIVMIFLKHEQIYDWFQDFEELKNFINITLVILLFIIFWSFTFLLGGFEKISTNNQNEPEFLYHKDIFSRLLEPKFFSPAKLEKSYDFVEFKNSKVALDELNNIIMDNGKLPYFGFDGKFWVWFMQNNEKYRVFFVLKDDKLTIIVTMVLENDKFQIIKYLSKSVNAKSASISIKSMRGLE